MKPIRLIATVILTALTIAGASACSSSSGDKDGEPNDNKIGTAKGFKSPPAAAGNAEGYQPITEPGVPITVGFGVDLNNEKGIPNTCIDGETIDVPNQEGFFSLDAEYNRSEIETALGASASGGVQFGLWGASARASYSQKTKENQFGLNYVVFAYNKDHSKVFVPSGRKESWKLSSPAEWNASCGSGYVAAQDYGSMLMIIFSLKLDEKQEERNWSTSAKGNYMSFAKLKAAISGNSKSKKSKGKLSLSAIQFGGKPSELGKILLTDSGEGLIEQFALCDVADGDKCIKGLRSIENYIANVFPAQIADRETGNSAVLTTYPFLYPKNVGSDFNPGVDEFVVKARKDLGSLYDREMSELQTVVAYKKDGDQNAESITGKMRNNLKSIRTATAACYETATYGKCATLAEELAISCAETVVPEGFGIGDSGQGNSGSSSGE